MPAGLTPQALALHARGEGESAPVEPTRLLAGTPAPRAWNGYTDTTGQFFAGVWQAEAGRWRVVYAAHEEEFCVLLEGQVLLLGADGHEQRFGPGDAFVVPGGFEGEWCNLTRVRKHYAIMQLKDPT